MSQTLFRPGVYQEGTTGEGPQDGCTDTEGVLDGQVEGGKWRVSRKTKTSFGSRGPRHISWSVIESVWWHTSFGASPDTENQEVILRVLFKVIDNCSCVEYPSILRGEKPMLRGKW